MFNGMTCPLRTRVGRRFDSLVVAWLRGDKMMSYDKISLMPADAGTSAD